MPLLAEDTTDGGAPTNLLHTVVHTGTELDVIVTLAALC